ncbi:MULTISPECIES: phosphatase PAP2 family protein [Streptomyces]|uniref:Phosphatidic acid phosphatase type 2/haloperoxidase domain-containing protein n=1 Tax=Streptomyces venezuelae TaxID=54571 RepID=A0A5P2BFX5_STRVZ|nr:MULTISPECIES: phosphatase PAP2 family protein [Streptomyces]NDZ99988.1 phosphatase PAP2 family protein [Streptomyces sp. SID10116]MYY84719.1 phosphatase PAP2 family protein [Streptomyces sp. SID335]MYZ14387.1 phosphatase PAP2 family protein [Streptomyces sp. SID337]NDZ89928.1 phosphatase PAP2 family protein [Streptomyces sp. SID10115]NEB49302.1 phosphatase PAP2 family protein [Streptomyces sp. SID339]
MDTMTDDLYRDITEFAHDTPSWFQHLAEVWTELGLLLFGVLFIVAWWRARRGDPRALAVAVLAPLATAVAYVCSELAKSAIDEERPCRAVSGALTPLVECPPHGDWSFPSNHSTIAGAAAIGLALAWPRIAALTVPMAVLMAFSRVFVGVHYPHDVAVGLVFGALIVFLLVRVATRPVARITLAMRGSSTGIVTWFAGPGPGRGRGRGRAHIPAQASAPAPAPAPSHQPPVHNPGAYDPPTMTIRRDDTQRPH